LHPAAAEDLRRRLLSGNMAAVARHFGVTRQAVWDFVHRRAKLQQVATDLREGMKDNVESALYNAALAGEAWAVCFFLKTQARDRGYSEHLDEAEFLQKLDVLRARAPETVFGDAGCSCSGCLLQDNSFQEVGSV
jgi:hypothetical protein